MKKRMERVELHCHSKYSRYDSVISPYEMLTYADSIEMPAVAIMDCASILGFPDMGDTPVISLDDVLCHRDGLLLGSGGENGILYDMASNQASESELLEMAKIFDYIEVLPYDIKVNRTLIELGKKACSVGYPLSLKVDATMANGASSVARTLNAPMFQRGGFFL